MLWVLPKKLLQTLPLLWFLPLWMKGCSACHSCGGTCRGSRVQRRPSRFFHRLQIIGQCSFGVLIPVFGMLCSVTQRWKHLSWDLVLVQWDINKIKLHGQACRFRGHNTEARLERQVRHVLEGRDQGSSLLRMSTHLRQSKDDSASPVWEILKEGWTSYVRCIDLFSFDTAQGLS